MTSEGRGGEVHLHTHVRAYHRLTGATGGEVWMVAGHYEARLVHRRTAWKIIGLTLKVLYQDGNLELPKLAQTRASVPQPIKATPA